MSLPGSRSSHWWAPESDNKVPGPQQSTEGLLQIDSFQDSLRLYNPAPQTEACPAWDPSSRCDLHLPDFLPHRPTFELCSETQAKDTALGHAPLPTRTHLLLDRLDALELLITSHPSCLGELL